MAITRHLRHVDYAGCTTPHSVSFSSGVFADAAPAYRNALAASGLPANIKYIDPTPPAAMNGSKQKRKRKRNVVWFNPPYSKSVRTNIAGTFLRLIDKHFPKGSKMNKIFNRFNVKVSYSCLPNMAHIISGHNKRQLCVQEPDKPCNCRRKDQCPLNGACQATSIVYAAEVWELKDNGKTHDIKWRVVQKAKAYSNITKRCSLCLEEKARIITADRRSSLNKRSELISKCRQQNKFMLSTPIT